MIGRDIFSEYGREFALHCYESETARNCVIQVDWGAPKKVPEGKEPPPPSFLRLWECLHPGYLAAVYWNPDTGEFYGQIK